MLSNYLKTTHIVINREIKLNSRRLPDVSADPSSENPPQDYQGRHTVETRALSNVNKDHFSQFSPCMSLENFPFIK